MRTLILWVLIYVSMTLCFAFIVAVYRREKFPYHARYDDGKLFYEGEWYSKGHHIVIDNKEDSPVKWVIN